MVGTQKIMKIFSKIIVIGFWEPVSLYFSLGLIEQSSLISFIHSEYFCNASSSPLLLRGAPEYSIDTLLTHRSATGNCK